MKKFYLVLLALLLVRLTTVVFAAPPDPGQPCPQGFQKHHGFHKFGARLNLTQEQREKTVQIRKSFLADVHDLKYDIRIKRVEVQKLFTDPKTDDATLLAKEKELNYLKLKLMDRKAEMKVEWRKVLTPAQIQMLERGELYHHGHHHHGGPMDKGLQPEPAGGMKH